MRWPHALGCEERDRREIDLQSAATELVKCRRSFPYWIGEYAKIIDPPTLDSPGGVIPFTLWPNVRVTMDAVQRYKLISIMKSRQIGESLILVGWNEYGALFRDGWRGFFFSKGENESMELITKARNMYDQLPGWQKYKLNPDSRSELGFPDLHSVLKAFPATPDAGISFTASCILMDEAEYMEYAEWLYTNAKPVIDGGGQLIFCFTVDKRKPTTLAKAIFIEAYETRQKNHPICDEVKNMIYPVGPSKNGFVPIFFPYWVRPGRDEAWYERTMASIPKGELQGLTPELYMEENYPRCLAPDTLVETRNGLTLISEAPDKSFSGVATLYRLTTEQGRILEGTPEHRILTPDGYKELGSLSPGDTIRLKQPLSMFYSTWIGLPTHFQGENRGLSIDVRWARFLGIFAGDGSISGHYDTIREAKQGISVVVDSKDTDFLKMVEDDFDALFGAHNTRKFRKANCMEVRISRHWLVEVFKAIGMVKPSGKTGQAIRKVCVPPVILQGPPENARAFLQGIFETDGGVTVEQRHSCIRLAAKDGDFLRQVQFLLLAFGITSRVAPGKVTATVRGKKGAYTTNTLTLRKPEIALFDEKIGFLSERKKAECHKILSVENNGFNKAKPIVMEDTVASVENTGIQSDVFDLVDQPDQCFSANGIWVHNSVDEALRATQTVAAVDLKVLDEMKRRCTAPVSVEGLDPLICKV